MMKANKKAFSYSNMYFTILFTYSYIIHFSSHMSVVCFEYVKLV